MDHDTHPAPRPKLISFDVFGTLISVRDSSYSAFERILADAGAHHLDVKAFWEHWEHRNIAHYWDAYRSYREICELSLAETFAHFHVVGDSRLIDPATSRPFHASFSTTMSSARWINCHAATGWRWCPTSTMICWR